MPKAGMAMMGKAISPFESECLRCKIHENKRCYTFKTF